ncbi:MAG TPA: helix-turn-helix domain-containing protein [Pirellulales bacterium]|nr:helix-turn-helix domain-containing protein [Pirellulales bacterium]
MSTASFDASLYLDLVAVLPLRPIRSERELDRAVKMLDALLDRPKLSRTEQDYLEVLSDLVEKYEAATDPIEPLSDADMLRSLMEARGMTQLELAAATGIVNTTLSAVLHGKRRLSREHVGRVTEFFGLSPAAFAFAEPRKADRGDLRARR